MNAQDQNLWPQAQWDNLYEKTNFRPATASDPIRHLIERHFRGTQGSCLEFGCFPGQFLAVFGEMGYELNGIDLTPRVESDLVQWLRGRNYRVGEILQADVLTYPFKRQFDVVCSFGFMEHFTDWAKVLARHAELVAPGGHLLITTPNFRGAVPHLLHRWLDAENLARHNVEAMNPVAWADCVARAGLKVIEAGGLGSFDFWVEPQSRSAFARMAIKVIFKTLPIWQRVLPAGPLAYAGHCMLSARRQSN